MNKKPTIISGSFNSFGYVLRKNSRIFYAAGNCPHDSQSYLGTTREGDNFVKGNISILGPALGFLSIEQIGESCKVVAKRMVERPDLYDLPENPLGYELGKVAFSASLNPMKAAYKCGALT